MSQRLSKTKIRLNTGKRATKQMEGNQSFLRAELLLDAGVRALRLRQFEEAHRCLSHLRSILGSYDPKLNAFETAVGIATGHIGHALLHVRRYGSPRDSTTIFLREARRMVRYVEPGSGAARNLASRIMGKNLAAESKRAGKSNRVDKLRRQESIIRSLQKHGHLTTPEIAKLMNKREPTVRAWINREYLASDADIEVLLKLSEGSLRNLQ